MLSDGTVFQGKGFGASRTVSGEVVFNTGMVGYPESITDPSYWGQILVQTYPLIGNYGVFAGDLESALPKITGYAVSGLCRSPNHHSSQQPLDSWLADARVPGIEGIDTRALTKHLRERGTMLGVLKVSDEPPDTADLIRTASSLDDPNTRDLTSEVTCHGHWTAGSGRFSVSLIDCGAKRSIIDSLASLGARVDVFPVGTSFDDILEHGPSGIVISNGPGDPKLCQAISCVRQALEQRIPILGVCLGNQILGLAAGADTYKLPFGHRSQNQPCLESGTRRCFITSQNHGFAISTETLPEGWREWFVNVNDRSNEGIIHSSGLFMSVQFHPEASPGPVDTRFLFSRFIKTAREWRR